MAKPCLRRLLDTGFKGQFSVPTVKETLLRRRSHADGPSWHRRLSGHKLRSVDCFVWGLSVLQPVHFSALRETSRPKRVSRDGGTRWLISSGQWTFRLLSVLGVVTPYGPRGGGARKITFSGLEASFYMETTDGPGIDSLLKRLAGLDVCVANAAALTPRLRVLGSSREVVLCMGAKSISHPVRGNHSWLVQGNHHSIAFQNGGAKWISQPSTVSCNPHISRT